MFDTAFDRVIGFEGGYINHPDDPGGETKWGISKRSYPTLDIKNLTRQQARDIYKRDFWDKLDCDSFPPALGFQVFDCAVNSGPEVTTKLLSGNKDPVLFLAARLEFMTSLKGWKTFGKGWARRIAQNLRYTFVDK